MIIKLKQALVALAVTAALASVSGVARAPSVSLEAYVPVACSAGFTAARTQFDADG